MSRGAEAARAGFGWGQEGLQHAIERTDGPLLVVVVDVLSFSTAVDVACGLGAAVLPLASTDDAEAIAAASGARAAGARSGDGPSLSPASLLGLTARDRLVLPSPNGGALSAAAARAGATVLAGSLRNARATARTAQAHLDSSADATVTVLAAGERWPNGALRPALEDLVGAGRVLAALDPALRSIDASAAALTAALDHRALRETSSAQELLSRGFEADVALALQLDASATAPVLVDGWFVSDPA
jgi:2-phosphosulfolactate phosphatase